MSARKSTRSDLARNASSARRVSFPARGRWRLWLVPAGCAVGVGIWFSYSHFPNSATPRTPEDLAGETGATQAQTTPSPAESASAGRDPVPVVAEPASSGADTASVAADSA